VRYAYWSFTCKSCGFPLLVTYIGPHEEDREIPPLSGPEYGGIDKICQSCGQAHHYKRSEATVFLGGQPPAGKF